MEFRVRNGNYLKSTNSTNKMMKHLIISLMPIILFAFYKNGILPYIKGYSNILLMLKPLIMVIVGSFTCLFSEFLWYKFIVHDKKNVKELICEYYSFIPGIFLSLVLPINTSYLILIIGSVFASVIGKLVYGGFGHNIFNPALVGRIFIIVSYGAVIMNNGGYFNSYETVDAVTSATPLSNLASVNYVSTYSEVVEPYGNLWNFFFGNIPGVLGEVSKILCVLAFLYLTFNKVIKWRIPVMYVLTVFIMSMVVGFINGEGLWYPLFHVLSGGLLFGAVFMATDPVTSPITKRSQTVYGICLGLLTIVFRFLTPYPEGVLSSILFMNLLVPLFNNFSIKHNKDKYKNIPLIIVISLALILSIYIGVNIKNNINNNVEESYLNVVSENNINGVATYNIKYRGFTSNEAIEATIVFEGNRIINITVTNTIDHYYDTHIKNTDFINKLIINQNSLDNVDTVSGATYTSKYLKEMVSEIYKYHEAKYE